MTEIGTGHFVAVIGGATAGAEVASRLADRGVSVVVFEQNKRPYGKIEDGLPRWHVALRKKEYGTIDEKLSKPGVTLVPNTKIGRDVDFKELVNDWGFSAVVLANGAWRDRPVPIEGADEYVGRGLVYQNPFVIAFNHAERGDMPDAKYELLDGAIILGGGLASIDVAKIHTLQRTVECLRARGPGAPGPVGRAGVAVSAEGSCASLFKASASTRRASCASRSGRSSRRGRRCTDSTPTPCAGTSRTARVARSRRAR